MHIVVASRNLTFHLAKRSCPLARTYVVRGAVLDLVFGDDVVPARVLPAVEVAVLNEVLVPLEVVQVPLLLGGDLREAFGPLVLLGLLGGRGLVDVAQLPNFGLYFLSVNGSVAILVELCYRRIFRFLQQKALVYF